MSESPSTSPKASAILKYGKAIIFLTSALCLAGAWAGFSMPSSVFPQTDFPRVVILIDNGVMPGDEMMATITRPVEEAMKYIPGTVNIRSTTSRGSAAINVFFDWSTDMVESELFVLSRLSQIRNTLPPTADIQVHRLTFSAFPIIGISLTSTSKTRGITDLWETARYNIYPRFLRIKGVARINLVGGRVPEWHVVLDPEKLAAHHLTLDQVSLALSEANQFTPAGMHEENYQLYLSVVDNRLRDPYDIENVVVSWAGQAPVRVGELGSVRRGEAPLYNRVSADGKEAVLLNVYGQPDCNTVAIAEELQQELGKMRHDLAPDLQLAFFYDQSQFVREGVKSVWESILLGLALSVLVLYAFLRNAAVTVVAAVVIPVTVLLTLIGLRLLGMSFNLMTLGGIAAAVGLVIDDAIVVVEAIYAKVEAGHSPQEAVGLAIGEVGPALVASTLTPVVVFIPLAFLDGVPGVFFRALAVTMVVALLVSLVLAVTWTPVTAAMLIRRRSGKTQDEMEQGGPVMRGIIAIYAWAMRRALRLPVVSAIGMAAVAAAGFWLYGQLESDFLPAQDEGAFVIDYYSRPGTSLSETDRMLMHVEQILRDTPEIEGFSRRTGARLALAIAEPNTGDFLVKLKQKRSRATEEVIDELREKVTAAEPALHTEFPGVLGDLIGDLTWSPKPVEIKIFSTDVELLKQKAAEITQAIETIPGVVDVEEGLIVAGPSMRIRTDLAAAARAGLTPKTLGTAVQTAMLGTVSSYVLQGDRTYNVRVLAAPSSHARQDRLASFPLRSVTGANLTLRDVARIEHQPGILENHRDDLRQLVAVTARFAGVDLGHGIEAIKAKVSQEVKIPAGITIEYGGLYQQQQESFQNLSLVLIFSFVLVYIVLILEFKTLLEPLAIWLGALLALCGVVAALWLTGTTLNIVSILGAIIAMGVVHKNGILMFDYVKHLRGEGLPLPEAMLQSGKRRLRPVLMTSLTTLLGLLPLAYGVGAGADMLRPMAIAVIGSLFMSLLLSLVATPVFYYLMIRVLGLEESSRHTPCAVAAPAAEFDLLEASTKA
jgi:CzcA family heavy metal efflux pump